MRKDIHLRIEEDIAKEVEERAKRKGTTYLEEYNFVLKEGLTSAELLKEYKNILFNTNIIIKDTSYIKSLLEQSYADLRLDKQDPKKSANLNDFKIQYKKGKNNLND